MATQISICNTALQRLGVDPIASLDDNTPNARRCKALLPEARKTVLGATNWNFASTVTSLAQYSGEEILGWSYLYTYPKNCLVVRKVFNATSTDPQLFRVFKSSLPDSNAQIIACNISPAYMEFTADVEDASLFSAGFANALSWELAMELAPSFGKSKVFGQLAQSYILALDQAKVANSKESYQLQSQNSRYLDAR